MTITSKDFQFTRGKWIGVKDSGVTNEFGEDVFATGCGCQTEPYLSAHDALLISKAPEMLYMLIKCERTLREVYECDTTELKNLIKQATEI